MAPVRVVGVAKWVGEEDNLHADKPLALHGRGRFGIAPTTPIGLLRHGRTRLHLERW